MNYIVFDQTNFIFSHQLYSSTYHCNCYHIFMLPVAPTLIGRECWKTFHLNYVSHFWHIHWVFVRIARKVITQFSGRNFLSSILSAWFLKAETFIFTQSAPEKCNQHCGGNISQTCGGACKLSIYQLGIYIILV